MSSGIFCAYASDAVSFAPTSLFLQRIECGANERKSDRIHKHYIKTGMNTNFGSINVCLDVLSFAKEAWKSILSDVRLQD